jgi:hypothetical protein
MTRGHSYGSNFVATLPWLKVVRYNGVRTEAGGGTFAVANRGRRRGDRMRRREFIRLCGGAVLGWPFAARAQKTAMPMIGFLHSASPGPYADALVGFRQGLTESGYSEGQNVLVEYRWANGHYDQLPKQHVKAQRDLQRRQAGEAADTPPPPEPASGMALPAESGSLSGNGENEGTTRESRGDHSSLLYPAILSDRRGAWRRGPRCERPIEQDAAVLQAALPRRQPW